MDNLEGYLNYQNTANAIATNDNKNWIIYIDPNRPRGSQAVKLFYPGAEYIQCSSLFSAGQFFGIIMNQDLDFQTPHKAQCSFLKL